MLAPPKIADPQPTLLLPPSEAVSNQESIFEHVIQRLALWARANSYL